MRTCFALELAALQEEDFTSDLIGFEDEELARLLAAQDAAEGLTDEDAVPELPETPVTVAGDLWVLGQHRVLCGDATSVDAIEIFCRRAWQTWRFAIRRTPSHTSAKRRRS